VSRFFRNKPFAITVIAVLVLVVLLAVTAGGGLSGVTGTLGGIFSPVGSFFSGFANGVGDLFSSIFGGGSEDRIKELEERVALLEIQNQNLSDLEEENRELQDLLDYKQTLGDIKTVYAKVIFKSPGYLFDVFRINAGFNQGVREDMAVVNADGLVGIVTAVGGNWSEVTAIIDSRSAISAMVERTRDYGVVQGAVQSGETCRMTYLPAQSGAIPGDTVITSELSGMIPRGIKIGAVSEVSLDENKLQKNAVIDPAVDFTHVESVLVLIKTETGGTGGDAG